MNSRRGGGGEYQKMNNFIERNEYDEAGDDVSEGLEDDYRNQYFEDREMGYKEEEEGEGEEQPRENLPNMYKL